MSYYLPLHASSVHEPFNKAALVLALLIAAWLLPANPVWAEVRLPHLISDGMVLQRGKPLNFWGTADPGERVSVAFQNQTAAAVAGNDGRWQLQLGPFESSGPDTLTVTGKNKLIIRDVLVGEVWVCGGQSNMEFSMQYATNGPAEVAAADDPGLRFFNVEKTVAGKPQEDVGGRWKAARPQNVQDFSAVGYFFGRELRKVLNVPVGLIHNAWGGTPAESWTSYETLESDPEYQPILDRGKAWLATAPKVVSDYQEQFDQWKRAADQAESEGRPIPPFPKAPHEPRGDAWQRPSGLFNGMVMPLRNYRIAGVIWYQGEANTPRALQYRKLFPAMIGDWRRAWGEGDLPFLYVQLAYFLMGDAQADLNWALLQEAQLKTLSVPKTAMAVAADIGDAGDIHPKNKSDVGYRLALAAQAIAYGRDIPYSGPIYDSMSIEGAKIRLRFQHVYGGLIAKGSGDVRLARFQIAGDDHKFEVGEAKIEGETVVVSSPKVPNPVAVRYGFPWSPQCNLYNQVGLPASPFRTDDWPITVTGN